LEGFTTGDYGRRCYLKGKAKKRVAARTLQIGKEGGVNYARDPCLVKLRMEIHNWEGEWPTFPENVCYGQEEEKGGTQKRRRRKKKRAK